MAQGHSYRFGGYGDGGDVGGATGKRTAGALPAVARGRDSQALQANLNVLAAGTAVEEDKGARARSLAALLPRVNAEVYANLQNRNLRAFGISFPGLPTVVGPFSNYDFRIYAQQELIDLASYRALKSSERRAGGGEDETSRTRAT